MADYQESAIKSAARGIWPEVSGEERLRILEGVIREVRQQALRDALAAVQGEHLEEPNRGRGGQESGDDIYDRAVDDCERAIHELMEEDGQERELKRSV